MERISTPLPGAGLTGPPLVGWLAQLGLVDRSVRAPSFVEGMGRWLDWKQAIALSAVLQTPLAAPARHPGTDVRAHGLEAEFMRVQDGLTKAIAVLTATGDGADDGADFAPLRRRCTALQQAMDAAIRPLRAQLRDAVARVSPELARLAAIDAVLASTLARHEQAQLARLPDLLERHFQRLRLAHPEPDSQAAWLQVLRHDLQRTLLDELALRLQPALGLLHTLRGTAPRTS